MRTIKPLMVHGLAAAAARGELGPEGLTDVIEGHRLHSFACLLDRVHCLCARAENAVIERKT